MNPTSLKSFLPLGLLAATLLPLAQAPAASANQVLHDMSATLAAAQTFSFTATRELDGSLLGLTETGVRPKSTINALVRRPNDLSAHAVSKLGERKFVANGRTLTLFDSRTNFYAVVPMVTTLDGLVARLDEKYGFTPPLAEFALSDPYRNLRSEADTVSYLGRVKIGAGFLGLGGIECDHVALSGKEADAELWVGVQDHLPHQLVATFKNLPTKPQLRIQFKSWNLNAHATDADFTFTPPKGAVRIEMWTIEKMQAASQR